MKPLPPTPDPLLPTRTAPSLPCCGETGSPRCVGRRRFLFSPMLLAIAIIGGSVLGSNPCTTDPQDPCTHKCAYQGLAYVMDFSVFRQGHEQSYLHATDAAAHDYYFDACDVVPKSAAVCDGTTAQRPVAIQTWGAPQPPEFPADSCAGLGDASTRVSS